VPPKANIAFPTRYRFGWGRRTELAAEIAAAGITRPLVVTDPGVAALAPIASLTAGWPVFAGVSSNPTEDDVLAGVAAYRAGGCDGVIAIGGGSPMDAAKVIALVAGEGDAGPGITAAFALGGARARQIRADRIAPLVAVPTTSGTGSELSTAAVITDHAATVKRNLLHAGLMPRAVIADPELSVGLPPAITAATGLDALTHAIEALCAPGYHPMCDAIAIEAIALIFAHLPRAVAAGDDAEARGHLLMASGMAAVAFQKGLGLVHAMAHPLGAWADVHHGLANAVLLPHVLDVNRPAIGAACARLGAGTGDPVDRLIGRVRDLERAIGLPAALPHPGDDAIAALTRLALAERLFLATNPRPVGADEVAAIYARAFTDTPRSPAP
jgi:alcohol dehydrogenase class IV